MNGYKCIDMRNDILYANITTTCFRQYLLTIGVGPTEMVFSGITFLTSWQLTRESLHAVWHGTNKLVHNNHLTEAEASTSLLQACSCCWTTNKYQSRLHINNFRCLLIKP